MHSYNFMESGKPLKDADKALILLHGRGGSASDIITLANSFATENFYITAPRAANNTWYPYSFLVPEEQNEPWLSSAVGIVKRLIDELSAVTGTENIFIMGFSQGACLALETASRFADNYAGVAGFTGGLIGAELLTAKYQGDFRDTKVFIGNSDIDPHVPVERSEQSKAMMERLGARVQLKIYPGMAHTITREEIQDAGKWLNL